MINKRCIELGSNENVQKLMLLWKKNCALFFGLCSIVNILSLFLAYSQREDFYVCVCVCVLMKNRNIFLYMYIYVYMCVHTHIIFVCIYYTCICIIYIC